FFSSRRRHTRFDCDWSSDVCSSDLSAAKAEHRTGSRLQSWKHQQPRTREHWSKPTTTSRMRAYVRFSIIPPDVRFFRNAPGFGRSEERRVGKECRCRVWEDRGRATL